MGSIWFLNFSILYMDAYYNVVQEFQFVAGEKLCRFHLFLFLFFGVVYSLNSDVVHLDAI